MPPSSAARPGEAVPRHVTMVIQRFRPSFSGQGIQVESLCRALAQRGVRSRILTAAPAGAPDDAERLDGYEVRRLATGLPGVDTRPARWTAHFARRVFAELWAMRDRTDLVHVHALTDALYSSYLYCRLRRVPLLFEMTLLGEDDPISVRRSRNRLAGARWGVYSRCDGYVAMSRAFVGPYLEAGLAPERLRVIPQGVDTSRFLPVEAATRAAIRSELGIPGTAPVVAFVGSPIRRKGIDILLRAWGPVAAAHTGARLLVAGREVADDGALDEGLRALPTTAADRVLRLGQRDDPERVLAAADVFAFPTRREGFGTVIIEAMATGIPCVVARLPGITDLIFGEDDAAASSGGVIVEQEDAGALAEAIAGLLGDRERRARLGEAARRRAESSFDMGAIADRYLETYADLLATRGRS